MPLAQNSSAMNRAALRWLKEMRKPAPSQELHVLNLATAGLEMMKAGEVNWPDMDRNLVKAQLQALQSMKAADALMWLLGHPPGPKAAEQQDKLRQDIQTSPAPSDAAMSVLDAIWHRLDAVNGPLSPSSSSSPQSVASASKAAS
jgi:hypothetical protein